jgi:hypothetical protein
MTANRQLVSQAIKIDPDVPTAFRKISAIFSFVDDSDFPEPSPFRGRGAYRLNTQKSGWSMARKGISSKRPTTMLTMKMILVRSVRSPKLAMGPMEP